MEFNTVVVTLVVAVVALVVMRALRNISGAPFAIVNDTVDGYFEIISMFRVPMQKTSLYILDTVFSVYIVGTLVVFVWRGAWILIDLFLFPGNFTQSSWASLVIGYGGAVFAYLLQPFMRWICNRLTGGPRLIASDIFLLTCFIFTVNTWRGIWNLLNIYFLPDNLELSCWITHWVCFILLVLLKCSNSLLVRGVFIDGEEPGGRCVVFPVYYLRLIFEHEKSKKIKKIQQDFANKLKLENDNPKLSSVISNHIAISMNSKDLKGHGNNE
ncbi:uncharacterized protein LOC108739863 [Agrilus planipennis]|uniref:Uncharacterized protein LOC108739863 n=1 Tax=Agrilus planipennis TaxID=224129 RepID=A0A7F5RCV3_AGRPL|nr:uncharacterized protein LOC108739863 [Agrilus planipennis]